MNKRSFAFAFGIGLAAVAWVGLGFVGTSWLALAMTVVIAGVYLFGAFELRQFRVATAALGGALEALSQPPAALADWLETVPPALRNAVRLRVQGERGALPGPALTPYLVGLLVMLGMLGTFLGMVVTFKGAVFALEGSTDLGAIRGALAGPLKGLGLSFGTSVAGVAASAMLGLMSAISRRERLEVARQLETRIATVLQPFSLTHQRQETFRALQAQAHVLPGLVDSLQALMDRIEQRSADLDRQLLERQAQFQREVTQAYGGLAERVGTSLQDSLAASARTAGDTIRPVVQAAMAQLSDESRRMHERIEAVARSQVDTLSQQFGASARTLAESFTASLQSMGAGLQEQWRRVGDETLAAQQAVCRALEETAGQVSERTATQAARTLQDVARLVERSEALVHLRSEAEARFTEQHAARMDEVRDLWRGELAALRSEEQARGAAAVQRLGELQSAVAQHLATLGAALEAPITRMLQTAAEVPQAAAGVIAQLREEMGRVAERDNLALQERSELLEQLATLLQSLQQASGDQRAAIDAMVASAATVLEQAGARFAQSLQAQAGNAAELTAQVGASAVELASLAEAFNESVSLFQASNEKLTTTLQGIEGSLNRSTARSDEQLAYYVAQAREVIDLSLASQQGLIENLRQLQAKPAPRALPAAEEIAQ